MLVALSFNSELCGEPNSRRLHCSGPLLVVLNKAGPASGGTPHGWEPEASTLQRTLGRHASRCSTRSGGRSSRANCASVDPESLRRCSGAGRAPTCALPPHSHHKPLGERAPAPAARADAGLADSPRLGQGIHHDDEGGRRGVRRELEAEGRLVGRRLRARVPPAACLCGGGGGGDRPGLGRAAGRGSGNTHRGGPPPCKILLGTSISGVGWERPEVRSEPFGVALRSGRSAR